MNKFKNLLYKKQVKKFSKNYSRDNISKMLMSVNVHPISIITGRITWEQGTGFSFTAQDHE